MMDQVKKEALMNYHTVHTRPQRNERFTYFMAHGDYEYEQYLECGGLEDGSIPAFKLSTYRCRLNSGCEITLALLLGCDYSQGVHGLGPESACQIVKSVGDNVVLQKVASKGLSFVKKKRSSKKQGAVSKCNNSKEDSLDHDMNVNDFWDFLSTQFACVENHRKYGNFLRLQGVIKYNIYNVSWIVWQIGLLYVLPVFFFLAFLFLFFVFTLFMIHVADEYIPPKIAEQNLRRFCNLQSTSSDLGLKLPLQKALLNISQLQIPVKCPVSKIIKHRKVQGRDCYEVSWEDLDGLKTSIVLADLVESACPEKIVEFEEERAERKKQNHRKTRPKKSEKGSSVTEIDLKL
ncbi:hypothetical protein SO802_024164 [Lithocarpus litseifolius]|uniref:Single-strand DNA endonuclease 1 chromo domain-containing protein n=1 Tax=Lithocarpus litseifolius TaxID=425828 RepID=A0AAW2C8G5_9ROSI